MRYQHQRSYRFEAYLRQLRATDPELRKQILAAEREFLDGWHPKLGQFEAVFADQMEGYEDTPAGPHISHVKELIPGDWSWKPERDKALGDKFVTFPGVPPSAAEMTHRR